MSDIQGYKYVSHSFDENANNGLGAKVAHFVVVHKGRENEANSLANAFKAAKDTLRVRSGMVHLRQDQVGEQISKLKSLPGRADTLGEFMKAQAAMQDASMKASSQFTQRASRGTPSVPAAAAARTRPQVNQGMRV